MDLHAACRAASETAARIDARIKTKLVKHARKHRMSAAEGTELAEALKRAAKHTKRLHLDGQHRHQCPPGGDGHRRPS